MSSRYVTAYNVTDRPVVVDDAGHLLDGGQFGCADSRAEAVETLYGHGSLVFVDDPGDLGGLAPQAAEAFQATRAANGTRKRRTAEADSTADHTPED